MPALVSATRGALGAGGLGVALGGVVAAGAVGQLTGVLVGPPSGRSGTSVADGTALAAGGPAGLPPRVATRIPTRASTATPAAASRTSRVRCRGGRAP